MTLGASPIAIAALRIELLQYYASCTH